MRVLIAGAAVSGLISCEVDSNNYARGDTFHLEMNPTKGSTWFDVADGSPPVDVTLQGVMLPPGAPEGSATGWTTIIQGGGDTIGYDPVTGRLTIEGRDYCSKLIELSTSSDVYLNNVSADVAADLAERAGLQWEIDPTSTPIGQYYQVQHKRHGLASHSRQTTAWDLLMRLARIERYDLWVFGTSLYFKKQLSDTTAPYQLPVSLTGEVPSSPVMDLHLDKQSGITKGVRVEVLSWDSRQRVSTTATWPPAGSVLKVGINPQIYTFVLPNLTQAMAQAEAQAYYTQIRAHQRTVKWRQPGDFSMTPRQRVQLVGTGTGWDAIYRIDQVHRSYTRDRGLEQTLTVRNRDLVASEVDGSALDS